MKKFNKKGFTLVEMLVVIAIIAVLVSIIIPTVSGSTEKAKEAADAANIRAAVAELTTNALAGGITGTKNVTIQQETAGWVAVKTIGGIGDVNTHDVLKTVKANDVVTLTVNASGAITVTKG